MRWWRIADPGFAIDKTGYGMSLYGGRWNSAGVPAVYAAATIELAALEKWVHLSGIVPALKFVLVSIDVPDEAAIEPLNKRRLPKEWNTMPSSPTARRFGDARLRADGPLGFVVPSAIVAESSNLVLNPAHADMRRVKFAVSRDFVFDPRMLK